MRSSVGVRCALIAQSLTIVVELIAFAVVRAPYSLLDNTISDLAATSCTTIAYPDGPVPVCSPAGAILNISWVVAGLLLSYAAFGLRPHLMKHRPIIGLLAFISLLISGLSTIGSGLVPLDKNLTLHALVSVPAILFFGVAMSLAAVALRDHIARARLWAWLGAIAAVCGVAVIVGVGPGLTGLLERVSLWVPTLWFAMLGENWRVWVRSEDNRRERHTGRHRPAKGGRRQRRY